MSGEALRASIEAEGRARVEDVLRDAQARAAKLRRDARAEAARRQQLLLAREEARLRSEGNVRLAAVRAEAQRRVLVAREELLDRIFDRGRSLLDASAGIVEAQQRLCEQARRALAYLPEGEVRVLCSPGLEVALTRALSDRSTVRVECDPEMPAGFRAVGREGALVVDATFLRLLQASRPALSIELLRRIDAEEAE